MSNTANSEKAPRVSVLMSVYDGERFLRDSVESILGQRFADFEFIILDDGSTDSTWDILNDFGSRDKRIILIRNNKNIGLTKSLNKGLALARGEYLARQDADDLSLPQRLGIQVKFLDAHPEVSLVGTDIEIIDENGKHLIERHYPSNHESITAELLLKNHAIGHSTVLARLEALKEFGGYDERLPYAQDYDLWWRLSRKRKVANLPEILVKWRDTPGSISRDRREEQHECIFTVSLKVIRESLKDTTLDEEAYRRFWWAYHGYIDKLQKGDIKDLELLWDLLASKRTKIENTCQGLQFLVYNLIRNRKFREAARLMKILKSRLNQPLNWVLVIKGLARSFIM